MNTKTQVENHDDERHNCPDCALLNDLMEKHEPQTLYRLWRSLMLNLADIYDCPTHMILEDFSEDFRIAQEVETEKALAALETETVN